METNSVEKIKFTNLTQEVMRLIRKHAEGDSELEKDLIGLINQVEDEELKHNKIRMLAYELADKLS